ncbi:hypothetical protein LCGC14_2331890, partial [marine sediment metagenome]
MTEPKEPPKAPAKAPPKPDETPEAKVQADRQALADSIDAGVAIEYAEQPGGDVAPAPSPATSAEKKPKAEETPEAKEAREKLEAEASASKEGPGEGEPKVKGKPGEGDEDPFKGLAELTPKELLSKLLEHSTVGPILQGWADRSGDAQSLTAVEQERVGIADEAKRQAENGHWDEHFGG